MRSFSGISDFDDAPDGDDRIFHPDSVRLAELLTTSRLGGFAAGAGSTSADRPGVMLPSSAVEPAPVQDGTFAGRLLKVKNPMSAKA